MRSFSSCSCQWTTVSTCTTLRAELSQGAAFAKGDYSWTLSLNPIFWSSSPRPRFGLSRGVPTAMASFKGRDQTQWECVQWRLTVAGASDEHHAAVEAQHCSSFIKKKIKKNSKSSFLFVASDGCVGKEITREKSFGGAVVAASVGGSIIL